MALQADDLDNQETWATQGIKTFSNLSSWQPFFIGFFFVILFEMLALSLLLIRLNRYVAWAHLVVSAAGLWWLAKCYAEVRRKPTVLGAHDLLLHAGPSLKLRVPITEIGRVELKGTMNEVPVGCLSFVPMAEPEVIITFKNTREISGRFLKKRIVSQIGVTFDDSASFVRALAGQIEVLPRPHS